MWPSVSRLPTKLGSWASSYQIERTVISQDHQPIALQYPEIGDGEKIYAMEIGKCYKSGLFTPAPAPKKTHLLNIDQHSPAGTSQHAHHVSKAHRTRGREETHSKREKTLKQIAS